LQEADREARKALDEILKNATVQIVLSGRWITFEGGGEVLLSPGGRRLRQIRGRSVILIRVVPINRGEWRLTSINEIAQ
jgi:hypothetical protein